MLQNKSLKIFFKLLLNEPGHTAFIASQIRFIKEAVFPVSKFYMNFDLYNNSSYHDGCQH